jgi:hypothetical protein
MKRITLLAVALILTSQAHAQALYKCTDATTGATTYSQTQCPEARVDVIEVQSTAPTPLASNQDLAQRCTQSTLVEFKDPDSVQILAVGRLTAEVIDYANTRLIANVLPIQINARNSYGGYVGATWYKCYISQNDKKVLAMSKY